MGLRNPLFVVVTGVVIFASGCGSGAMTQVPPPAPMFTSTPGTAAVQGAVYSYQVAATDPTGKAVSFALGSAPAGATLSGNMVTWTPTATESRVANSFSLTATTAEGGSASQTWSVTPAGTVTITRVDTRWSASGPVMFPFNWSAAPGLNAGILVPQTDGTMLSFTGTGSADGTLTIPNVPGGFYWLKLSPLQTYWTSTSSFDAGANIIEASFSAAPTSTTTTFDLNLTGLDPWQTGDLATLNLDNGFAFEAFGPISVGSTSGTATLSLSSNIDFSKAKSALIGQEEVITLGTMQATVLGPTVDVSNLTVTNGTTNMISGALVASPKSSLNLTVNGSDWVNLFNNAAPVAATQISSAMGIKAQAYFTGGVANSGGLANSPVPPLFVSGLGILPALGQLSFSGGVCENEEFSVFGNPFPFPPGQTSIVTNTNFGVFQYGDPFEQDWPRLFSYCQEAEVSIPDPSSTNPLTLSMGDGLITNVPTGPVEPLVGAVQNPTINGASLFTGSTLNTGTVSLSWNAPSGATPPTGYVVELLLKTILPPPPPPAPQNPLTVYAPIATLFTTKTSMTVPYTLVAGDVFLVKILARVDGKANYESSPNRLGVPIGSASVVSAIMTVGATAMAKQGQIVRPAPHADATGLGRTSRSNGIILQKAQ